jgi:cardiolipin synthase (CMP-forming)
LSIPNLITLARILLVPVIVWAIASNEMQIAFGLFVVAGLSDLVDGFLAKRFRIYVTLGIVEAVPRWLVILVVSRDIMIVTAVILSWLVDRPVKLKPLTVSKINTLAQILLAAFVLARLGIGLHLELEIQALTALVAALTLLSIAFYLAAWVRHMNAS